MGKGMRIAAETLLFFVIIVIVLALALGAANTASGFVWEDYFTATSDLGDQGNIDNLNPDIDNPEPFKELLGVRIITTEGQENQPSEIACSISDDIHADLSTNGLTARDNCYSQYYFDQSKTKVCLVELKSFILGDSTDDPSWESILSGRSQPCHLCVDDSTGKQISTLDEVCINDNLKDKKINNQQLCTGLLSIKGTPFSFGNDNCAGFNSANWNSQCGVFCGNDNDMIFWIADNNADGRQNSTLIKDNGLGLTNGLPLGGITNSPANLGDDWRISKHDGYVYGVVWVESEKRYAVYFERTPLQLTADSFDFIKGVFTSRGYGTTAFWYQNPYIERWKILGFWRQEPRMVIDATVTLPEGTTKHIGDILAELAAGADLTPDKIDAFYGCSSDKCITTSPQTLSQELCGGYQYVDDQFREEPIKFVTSEGENGDLIGGNSYRVIITNWYGREPKAAGTSGPPSCYSYYDRAVIIVRDSQNQNPPQPTVDPSLAVVWTLKVDNSPENPTYQSQPGQLCVTGNVFGSSEYCTPSCIYPCKSSISVTLNKNQPVTVRVKPDSNNHACIFSSGEGYCNPALGTYSFQSTILPLTTGTYNAYFY
jgi:hypothetical protein